MYFFDNIMTDYVNIGKKDDDDTHTSSLLMSAQQSFLSSAQYSSPHLNSSLILTPSSKNWNKYFNSNFFFISKQNLLTEIGIAQLKVKLYSS